MHFQPEEENMVELLASGLSQGAADLLAAEKSPTPPWAAVLTFAGVAVVFVLAFLWWRKSR